MPIANPWLLRLDAAVHEGRGERMVGRRGKGAPL